MFLHNYSHILNLKSYANEVIISARHQQVVFLTLVSILKKILKHVSVDFGDWVSHDARCIWSAST